MSLPILWNEHGLAPAVCVDRVTGQVLMLAWMNAEALELTRASGDAWFWSRSRKQLWRKGDTSGNVLRVFNVRVDCDGDAILLEVIPEGPACHTGHTSCFHRLDAPGGLIEDEGPIGVPAGILGRVERTIDARRASAPETSYVKSLLVAGMDKILAKIAEEHAELAEELPAGTVDAIAHETADLLFHVLVGLASRGIELGKIFDELGERFGTSGHVEKASRPAKPKAPA